MAIVQFLKLIRLPNLLIIAASQYLLRYFIIQPLLEAKGFELAMQHLDFFLLSLSTVLIAAAGYVINDYFDLKIDRINKPDKIIIGRHIKRRVAMGSHIVMNSLGFILGGYVAYKVGNITLIFIHLFAIISLWYYSTHFKFSLLAGNLIISLMAALVPLLVGLYEVPLLNAYLQEMYSQMLKAFNFNFNYVAYWTIGYAIFAFLMTMPREITKDIMDLEGDKAYGANTLPISWGIPVSKAFIVTFYLVVIALLIFIQQMFIQDLYTMAYFGAVLIIPLLITIILTITGKSKKDFSRVSMLNKIISLLGILYAFLFSEILRKFIETQNF